LLRLKILVEPSARFLWRGAVLFRKLPKEIKSVGRDHLRWQRGFRGARVVLKRCGVLHYRYAQIASPACGASRPRVRSRDQII
jgi:hypothetical protein